MKNTKNLRLLILLFFLVSGGLSSISFAGLERMKPTKSRLVGFVTKESAGVLRLDTGASVFRLDAREAIRKNPRMKQEIDSDRQATVTVDQKDILSIEATANQQSLGSR